MTGSTDRPVGRLKVCFLYFLTGFSMPVLAALGFLGLGVLYPEGSRQSGEYHSLQKLLMLFPWFVAAAALVTALIMRRFLGLLCYIVGSVFGLAGMLGVFLFAYEGTSTHSENYEGQRAFDSAAWKRGITYIDLKSNEKGPTRLSMIDDLLKTHPLDGLARKRVVELLGPPDRTEYFREWDMVYKLGPERGMGVDFEWLVIRLDSSGKVRSYQVLTD